MKSGTEFFLDYYKKRYQKGELSEEQISQMVTAGTISEDEKQYIMEGGRTEGQPPEGIGGFPYNRHGKGKG